jgi:hypothetical protein
VQGKIEESLEMLKTTLKLKPDHEKGQAKLKQAKKAEKAKIAVRALKLERTRPTDRLWRLCGRSRCGWNCRHSRSKWMTPSRRPRRCKGEESYSTHSTVPHPFNALYGHSRFASLVGESTSYRHPKLHRRVRRQREGVVLIR